MSQRPSGHPRVTNDFYIEPPQVTISLIEVSPWTRRGFHDPFCGNGTIVDTATSLGIVATGADLVDRAAGRFPVRDYFVDTNVYPNIVGNPPFSKAHAAIEHALNLLPGGWPCRLLSRRQFFGLPRALPTAHPSRV
jgi:hypothetical protein